MRQQGSEVDTLEYVLKIQKIAAQLEIMGKLNETEKVIGYWIIELGCGYSTEVEYVPHVLDVVG